MGTGGGVGGMGTGGGVGGMGTGGGVGGMGTGGMGTGGGVGGMGTGGMGTGGGVGGMGTGGGVGGMGTGGGVGGMGTGGGVGGMGTGGGVGGMGTGGVGIGGAGLAGMGGVTSDSGCGSTSGFPSTGVLDYFDEPDGSPLSGQWIGPSPATNYGTSGGHLVELVPSQPLYWTDKFGPAQEAFATISDYDTNMYEVDLLLDAQDLSGRCESIIVAISKAHDNLFVGYCTDNTYVSLSYGPFPRLTPVELGARVFPNGCVDVFVNGTRMLTAQIPAADATGMNGFPYLAKGGRIGVYSIPTGDNSPGKSTEWDDFGGGNLQQ
jgi:hypothetical protein